MVAWAVYPALLALTGLGASKCDALGFGGARCILLSLAAVASAAVILIVSGAVGEYAGAGIHPLLGAYASLVQLPAVQELREPPATAILALALVIVFLHGLLELASGLKVVAECVKEKEQAFMQRIMKQN